MFQISLLSLNRFQKLQPIKSSKWLVVWINLFVAFDWLSDYCNSLLVLNTGQWHGYIYVPYVGHLQCRKLEILMVVVKCYMVYVYVYRVYG